MTLSFLHTHLPLISPNSRPSPVGPSPFHSNLPLITPSLSAHPLPHPSDLFPRSSGMPSSSSLFISPLFLFLLQLLILPSSQDTLFCGSSSFQVSLGPSRPSVIVAAGGAGTGLNPSGTSSAKYQFMGMDSLMRNVCGLDPQPVDQSAFSGRLVITRCEQCSKCPQALADIHRTLTRIALEAGLQSLLVILGKEFEHVRSTARLVQDTITKFVFLDEDDLGSPTICELSDSSDGDPLKDGDSLKSFSKTSVLFVSISFIILMVISLAWLVFYYVQRFRYAHAKDRLQRRLFNAAKKALARIPTRPVKAGDKELNSDCPVCIDPYRQGDIARQLPCRHIFHKSCVDPWLLEHRTCPMCKSDILKAFGYHVNGRRRAQFSANVEEDGATGENELAGSGGGGGGHRGDRLSLDAGSTGSESANPFPVVTEVHDPFGFSPVASPHLIQMVQGSPGAVQIVPLTVNVVQHPLHHPLHHQNPYCSVIQTAIERHSDADGELLEEDEEEQHHARRQMPDGEAEAEPTAVQHSSSSSSSSSGSATSTGLRLFRAVTGRGHARFRSFSQSQVVCPGANNTMMPSSNSASAGFGSEGEGKKKEEGEADEGKKEEGTGMGQAEEEKRKGPTRAGTAPGGFRRKAPTPPMGANPMTGGSGRGSQREKSGGGRMKKKGAGEDEVEG